MLSRVGDCDTLQQVGDWLAVMHVTSSFSGTQALLLSEESQASQPPPPPLLICVQPLLITGLPRQHHYVVNSDECHMLYGEVESQELSVHVAV